MNAQNPDTVTPKGLSLKGPALQNLKYEPRIQQYVHEWEMAVGNQLGPVERRFGDWEVGMVNERNRAEGRLRLATIHTGDKDAGVFVTRVDKEDDLAVEKLMPYIGRLNVTKKIVPAGTAPNATSWTKIRSVVRYYDEIHAEREDWDVVGDFHPLTVEGKDEDSDLDVTFTYDVVAPGTSPSGAAGFWDIVEQVDEWHALRVRRQIASGGSITSYDNIRYTFPACLYGWDTSSIFLEAQGRTFYVMQPQIRQEETKIVVARLVTTFSGGPVTPPPLYSFKTQDLRYDGVIFNVDVRACLYDSGSLFLTTNPNDAFWGPNVSEIFTYAGTTPWANTYLGSIGNEVAIGFTSTKWKYNLWKNITTYIELQ